MGKVLHISDNLKIDMLKHHKTTQGIYYVIAAGILWSMMGIGIRLIESANVWQILLYRSLSLVVFLYVVLQLKNKKNPFLLIYRAQTPAFFAAAGLFMAYSGAIYAVQNTTVANAMLLFASAPFITAILGYLCLGEKVPNYTIIAIAFAMFGIAIMVFESVGSNTLRGSAAGVISAFGFSIFTISLRWGKQTDMLPAVFLSGLLAITLTIPICYYQGMSLLLNRSDAMLALGLGVFQVGIGLVLYTIGSKSVPAAELTLLSLSEVLLGPIWVWLFLGEKASQMTFLGGIILLMAICYNSTLLIKNRHKKNIS